MEETVKTQRLVKSQSIFKMVIPSDVERKIRYLCQKIPNVEWSGTLFYTYDGSIEGGDLVITCRDIFVMDIGSSVYTEFDMSPDVISYMCDRPELLDMQSGLIHSHNIMSTFFSGTDTNTLAEEGKDRNHFVSLIVNNEGTYTAAITRHMKSVRNIQESYSYRSFGDIETSGSTESKDKMEYIEYFMLEITKEGESVSFRELEDRLSEIRKRKASLPLTNTLKTRLPDDNKYSMDIPYSDRLPLFQENNMSDKPEVSPYTIDKDDLRIVMYQLLTGSIILKDPSKIDIVKWVRSMPSLFGDRFGETDKGLKEFRLWAEAHCEFLILNKEPEEVASTASMESEWMTEFAISLRDMLDRLPSNTYIDIFKEILDQWIQ